MYVDKVYNIKVFSFRQGVTKKRYVRIYTIFYGQIKSEWLKLEMNNFYI